MEYVIYGTIWMLGAALNAHLLGRLEVGEFAPLGIVFWPIMLPIALLISIADNAGV